MLYFIVAKNHSHKKGTNHPVQNRYTPVLEHHRISLPWLAEVGGLIGTRGGRVASDFNNVGAGATYSMIYVRCENLNKCIYKHYNTCNFVRLC